ncbi:hypothetical protein [Arcanobacterium buesumense]|uniref:Uncharacterized protein n=1 Tax=Arcanobacterium buesumense TaxID=2722751 RepID=A0A6H2EJC1_9ACTO|nr:hypothetical protein [Arcanobacterium buesumense]QJC21234.1 hypothetical protein HC352_00985 [Arcanobacterium buesumense]
MLIILWGHYVLKRLIIEDMVLRPDYCLVFLGWLAIVDWVVGLVPE